MLIILSIREFPEFPEDASEKKVNGCAVEGKY
jgi:hypothetical protein